MKRLNVRSLLLSIAAVGLLSTLTTSYVNAQGAFPPSPLPTNTFTASDGHKYLITFVDVGLTLAAPNVQPNPGIAYSTDTISFSAPWNPPGHNPYIVTTTTAFTAANTSGGSLDIWRIAHLSGGMGVYSGMSNYTESNTGHPIFRFKITKLDKSTAITVNVTLATGVSGSGQAYFNGTPNQPFDSSATLHGALYGTSLDTSIGYSTLGTPPSGLTNLVSKSGQRFIGDTKTSTSFDINGIAYVIVDATPNATCTLAGLAGTSFGGSVDSTFEFIPIAVN